MHLSTSNFERVIPTRPWRGITVTVVVMLAVSTATWEIYCRSLGYGPSLNDTGDLWAEARRRVEPESLVIVGDSRALFDSDFDELEKGLGKRPVQLAEPGSTAFPVLANVIDDTRFHGTIICSVVPRLFFAPSGSPPMNRAEKSVRRYHTQTYAQRASHGLGIYLEKCFACMKQDDLILPALLEKLPIPNRPYAQVPPPLPPYFSSLDRGRRARMVEQCAQPGKLQEKVKHRWARLFTPPPPPSFIPAEVFAKKMHDSFENRFADTGRVQRDAATELHQDAHHLAALDLRDENRLGAIEDRKVRRLAGLLHQPAHVNVTLPDEITIGQEPGAHRECLKPDVPVAEIARLVDVTHFLERREQPVRRRRRKLDALRDVGQRDSGFGSRQRLEDVEAAREALHLRGDAARLRRRSPAAWRRGESVRHHYDGPASAQCTGRRYHKIRASCG